ncbi:MAG: saccharopine dehydrogenase [Alphaproteobacteria bacterium]|nr:saccharopine dehydrogenase [Alphaproteobacteria bacterium]
MADKKEFDVVVYGASGYTGRLVAEYLVQAYGKSDVRWAMAGRNQEKLAEVRSLVGAPADTPIIEADASAPKSLAAMADRTKVVLTTVGPYALYGEPLVVACAARGTDYVDLSGEVYWMRHMIDAHEAAAKKSGARIAFSCGFDSIPFDLGVWYLQETAKKRLGKPVPRIHGRVRSMVGKFSGGTAESMRVMMAAVRKDPSLIPLMMDPFALTPGSKGPDQPADDKPRFDGATKSWVAPFIMAAINTRNVHRTNFLLGHPFGREFTYDEMVLTGPGEKGEEMAKAVAAGNASMLGEGSPKPGEGPTKEERDSGSYDILFIGVAADGRTVQASVSGRPDPGYGSTSRMIAESALCLARDGVEVPGGMWTPAAAMAAKLKPRLERAGLVFKDETA